MSDRITAADVMRCVGNYPFRERLAVQMEIDERRLADLEAENGRLGKLCTAEAEVADNRSRQVGDLRAELAATRPDADQWQALRAVIEHPARHLAERKAAGRSMNLSRDVTLQENGIWCAYVYAADGETAREIEAPDPVTLLNKLSELEKPEPEPEKQVWWWRYAN